MEEVAFGALVVRPTRPARRAGGTVVVGPILEQTAAAAT